MRRKKQAPPRAKYSQPKILLSNKFKKGKEGECVGTHRCIQTPGYEGVGTDHDFFSLSIIFCPQPPP